MRVVIGLPGGGVWVEFGGCWGGGFSGILWKMKENGKGVGMVGGGVGTNNRSGPKKRRK